MSLIHAIIVLAFQAMIYDMHKIYKHIKAANSLLSQHLFSGKITSSPQKI